MVAIVLKPRFAAFLRSSPRLQSTTAKMNQKPRRRSLALSLELPKASIADIKRIATEDAADKYEIQTSFLGLYGASSPLPNFYTEDLIAAEQEDEIQAR